MTKKPQTNKLKSKDHCGMTGKNSVAEVPKKGKAGIISKTRNAYV